MSGEPEKKRFRQQLMSSFMLNVAWKGIISFTFYIFSRWLCDCVRCIICWH